MSVNSDNLDLQNETVMAVLPMFHIYGMTIVLLNSLCCGAKLVVVTAFQPDAFLATVERERCTLLYLAPPIVTFLVKSPLVDQYDLSSIKDMLCGAAPLSEELGAAVSKRCGAVTRQVYGMSELSPLATCMPFSRARGDQPNYESIGYLMPNMELMVRRVDPKDPPNEGEMLLRGPNVMKGYLGNEQATRETIREDGWMHTGDVIRLAPDGAIHVIDRMKELIKVKGFQVAPAELEAKLKAHPSVYQAGVIGIPDERAGEVPKAFVQLKPDVPAGSVTAEELIRFAAKDSSGYKHIKEIEFIAEVPCSKAGKILRRQLRDRNQKKNKPGKSRL